ncbi:hypothetical protein M406DRAFT_250526 [Cryphonectria parasitica EP155]|uniref:Uncharacterized protein n=1 Tax=Cryphonectria parasitica (strain ATCC 38755 / EP155) TaxID=660469 RepID=A0A9P4Y7F7_CRYP1|nr:uncharacterized protein M406DRAFT_250526 [Cryphonectria parasitica EP155]KAF3768354.1 hypothetical protein M406DRAFT_250526 [Cryphonectria parasitica EP155]
MSNRVSSRRVAKPYSRSSQKSSLLSAVATFSSLSPMPCSYCEDHNLSAECKVAESESSRCQTCVRLSLSNCDVRSLTSAQLNQVEVIEEEAAELNAKLLRLRKQKRMWYEKMMRAVRRGINNVKELERVEAEKRARIAAGVRSVVAEESAVVAEDSSFEGFDWNSVDVGNAVVDWSGFLESEVSEGPGSRSGAERSS